VRAGTGGADFLTALATTAAPLLSAALGMLRGWRFGWWTVPAAVALYLVAWLAPHGDLTTQAAGALLIAGACLALATGIAALAPDRFIAVGLVGLVILDVVLVWGTPQVETTTTTLHATAPARAVPRARAAHAPAPAPAGRHLRLGADGLARPARAGAPRRDREAPRRGRARDHGGRPRVGPAADLHGPHPGDGAGARGPARRLGAYAVVRTFSRARQLRTRSTSSGVASTSGSRRPPMSWPSRLSAALIAIGFGATLSSS
jgi:hypothetical protein